MGAWSRLSLEIPLRKLASLLALAVSTLAALSPVVAVSSSPGAVHGASYTVLQMNLCLSGMAGCYPRTAYPSIVDEAVAQVIDDDADAVTLNEVCSGDVAQMARRTGYHMRFTAVLYRGAALPCIKPAGRGVFGLAVLTKAHIRTSHNQAFVVNAGLEERRFICATTARALTVCSAHLSTRGSAEERRANDAECHELHGVLARYDAAGTTVFGGDVNRQEPCAPATMWTREDTAGTQVPGIQHIYGSTSLADPPARVSPATHTDHDFLVSAGEPGRSHITERVSAEHLWSAA